jgi:hypothetical protein
MNEAEADTSTTATAAAAAAVAATSALLPMVSGGKTWTIGTEVWVYWRAYANEPGNDRWVSNKQKKHNIVLFYSNMFFLYCFWMS